MDSTRAQRRQFLGWSINLAIWGILLTLLTLIEAGAFLQGAGLGLDNTGFWLVFIVVGSMFAYSAWKYRFLRREVAVLEDSEDFRGFG